MPNLSNKNFPHAYGGGRVVGAFQLAHPAAPIWDRDEESGYAPAGPPASSTGALNPYLANPALLNDFPYPAPEFPLVPPAELDWGYDWQQRQPYNATSFGVYVTGTGTSSLGYREVLVGQMDATIAAYFPGDNPYPQTGIYSPSQMTSLKLGSENAQFVVSTFPTSTGCGVPTGVAAAGNTGYYEVALDWSIPKYTSKQPAGEDLLALNNWGSKLQVNVTRELQRTFWVTASISANAQAQSHPNSFAPPDALNAYFGPVEAGLSGPTDNTASIVGFGALIPSGLLAPYSGQNVFWSESDTVATFDPSRSPTEASLVGNATTPGAWGVRPCVVQTEVVAAVTKLRTVTAITEGFEQTLFEAELQPRLRVWVLYPQNTTMGSDPGDDLGYAPGPLPRTGVNPPYSRDADFQIGGVPAVSVQVIQKNTNAPDGSDLPVYDYPPGLWRNMFDAPPPPAPSTSELEVSFRQRLRERAPSNIREVLSREDKERKESDDD